MEKEKRFVFIILVFLLIRIWFIGPYISSMDMLKDEYASLRRSVYKSQVLLDNAEMLSHFTQEVQDADAVNDLSFISADIGSKDALSAMQTRLRKVMENQGFEVISMTWGEPYQIEDLHYVRLPLSFVASSGPIGLHAFFEAISKRKPLLFFDALTIRQQRKVLRVTGQLIGFVRQQGRVPSKTAE